MRKAFIQKYIELDKNQEFSLQIPFSVPIKGKWIKSPELVYFPLVLKDGTKVLALFSYSDRNLANLKFYGEVSKTGYFSIIDHYVRGAMKEEDIVPNALKTAEHIHSEFLEDAKDLFVAKKGELYKSIPDGLTDNFRLFADIMSAREVKICLKKHPDYEIVNFLDEFRRLRVAFNGAAWVVKKKGLPADLLEGMK